MKQQRGAVNIVVPIVLALLGAILGLRPAN
jgi:hypothetical protein